MRLNAEFSKPAFAAYEQCKWVASPMAGVDRLMLDRVGAEHARATTIVRYAKGSRFSEHVHDRGEEYIVLEGVFSDQAGEHGPGTYVRNPDGSSHAPWSEDGCVIFVKLRQFQPGDDEQFQIATDAVQWQKRGGTDISHLNLHEFGSERVNLVRFEAVGQLEVENLSGGIEILVLAGELAHNEKTYGSWSWLRFPPEREPALNAHAGAMLYLKTGHLSPAIGIA